jgi:hypothetical protein
MRYSELVREIHSALPNIPLNTIHGNVWNLEAVSPAEVYKPARGVFKAVRFRDTAAVDEGEPEAAINTPGTRISRRELAAKLLAVLTPVPRKVAALRRAAGVKSGYNCLRRLAEQGMAVYVEGKGFALPPGGNPAETAQNQKSYG